jgi:hypothetical protein
MQFRWVAAITVWTFLSGPVFGPPHAPHTATRQQTAAASAKPRRSLPPRQPSKTSKLPWSTLRPSRVAP